MKKVYLAAALFALIGAALVYFYLQSLDQRQEEPTFPTLLAAVDIPAFTRVSPEMLELRALPAAGRHRLAMSDPQEAVGLLSESPILAGEQLLSGQLAQLGDSAENLAYLLGPGERAVTVAVDNISGVAGFLRQNDRVDVLVTIDLPQPLPEVAEGAAQPQEKREMTTLLVAEDIMVLTTGSSLTEQVDEEGQPLSYATVTLCATPEEAQQIVFAAAEGRVTLLLRAVLDDDPGTDTTWDRYQWMD